MNTTLDSHLIAKTAGNPNPKQVYTKGNLRVTVIAPELIRVEFDSRAVFLDKATQAVWFRNCGEHPYRVKVCGSHLIVITEKAAFFINTKKTSIDFVEIDGII